jgi:uncharacterized OsmC-like protein
MFELTLTAGPGLDVKSPRHEYHYATDGSAPNPLESTHAALAGCAGVYAKKACRELGIDDTGIAISMRVVARPGAPLVPSRIETKVAFPDRFDAAQRVAVLESIRKCAVKVLIAEGRNIEFPVEDADAPSGPQFSSAAPLRQST